jgi:ABC-2 type transport system permease protein
MAPAMRSVFAKSVYDARRSIAGWSVELVGIVVLIVAIYPSFGHSNAIASLGKSFPGSLTAFVGYGGRVDYASPVGFLGTELFTLMLPLVLTGLAIVGGARTIASEEEQATLDLLLANPISRTRLLFEKSGALLVQLALLTLVLFAALALSTRAWDVHIGVGRLAAASFFVLLIAALFGALAVAVGAATGRHDLAVGVPAGGAALAYLVNGVAPLVSWLSTPAKATPFYHYTTPAPLLHGFQLDHALALAAPTALLVVLAASLFARRDLR